MKNGSSASHLSRERDPGTYRRRILAAIVVAQAMVLLLFQLPVYDSPLPVGWYVVHDQPSALEMIDAKEVSEQDDGRTTAPLTRFAEPSEEAEIVEASVTEDAGDAAAPPPQPVERVPGLAVHDAASYIEGGLGAFYIHIEYPKAAVRANIQGRLILDFTLDEHGRATDIEVARSLHPLCDSAAVRALRLTPFVPARRNGEAIPIQMRLPVVFRIVEADPELTAKAGTVPR